MNPEKLKWVATDFVIDGRFCDELTFDAEMIDAASSLSAAAIVVIAWNRSRVYRTLVRCLLGEVRATPVETAIGRSLVPSDLNPLLSGAHSPSNLSDAITAVPVEATDLLRNTGHPLRLIVQRTRQDNSAAIVIAYANSQHLPQAAREQKIASHLHAIVNAHAAVVISKAGDARSVIDNHIKQWLPPPHLLDAPVSTLQHDGVDYNKFTSRLLKSACEVTRSQLARLFVPSRAIRGLRAVAQHGEWAALLPMSQHEPEVGMPDEDGGESSSVQQYCAKRKQPFLFADVNNIPKLYTNVYSDASALPVIPSRIAEMSVPILKYGVDSSPLWGVIDLFRHDEPYNEADLACVDRLTEAYREECARVLSGVSTTLLARIQRMTLTEKVWRRSESETRLRPRFDFVSNESAAASVPPECDRLMPLLDDILVGLFNLTPTCYANARILSLDSKQLIRLRCLHAQPRSGTFKPPFDAIPIDDRASVTAWCLRRGDTAYVPDYNNGEWFRRFPGLEGGHVVSRDSRSSYTSPITALGRAIGTLHLESVYENAFSDSQVFIDAVADSIGSAVSVSRRILEGDTLYRRSKRAALIHQLGPEIETLKKELDQHFAAQPMRFLRASHILNACRTLIKSLDSEPLRLVNNLLELCNKIIDFHGFSQNVFIEDTEAVAKLRLKWSAAGSVEIALTEILRNAFKYTKLVKAERFPVRLLIGERELGGRRYHVITVVNTATMVTEEVRRFLFRSAIRKDAKSVTSRSYGYGCLSAAALANQFGGDIYLARVDSLDSGTVEVAVCLDIPDDQIEEID